VNGDDPDPAQTPPPADDTSAAFPARLRVLHVITGLGQGGAESVLARLATCPASGVRHIVVSLTDEGLYGATLREAGVDVYALHMPRGRPTLGGFLALRRLIAAWRPNVVQTWMYHADLIGGLAARLAGTRAVAWGIRNSGAHLEKSSWSARLVLRICARLSGRVPAAIVCCAEDAARRHAERGYASERMTVVPNGYDLSRFMPDPAGGAALRAGWDVSPDDTLVGCVARWDPLKDHENLLAALAVLRQAGSAPGLRCVLVGRGMDAGNAELAAALRRHGLEQAVILAGPRNDIPAVMSALDLHVLPSRAEGFPNVVAEAMACGTPCLVTDVGDAALIVGDTGWVVRPEDARALAGGIAVALTRLAGPDRPALAEACRERVEREFSLSAMVDGYRRVWTRIAQGDDARPRRLLLVVNNPAFFLSHRLPVALGAREAGYDVHVATMAGPAAAQIVAHGLTHHAVPMSRSGRNPLAELRTMHALWRLMRRLRPDVAHLVTIKPVLYGGLAARLAGVPGMVAAISGLGFVFVRRPGRADWLRAVVAILYRLALGHANSRVIFQNGNDRDLLLRMKAVRPGQVVMVRGAGVDLDRYRPAPEPPEPPVNIVMAARLLRDKGVYEFVEAARLLRELAPAAQCVLAGGPDPGNPASVTDDEVAAWRDEAIVQCLGEVDDIAALYARAHIVALPSYREGLPKSLVEAAACGRAVVTTDVPGCRDAIEPGQTGVLVPVRDAPALARALAELAGDADRRRACGQAGRQLAEREFDIRKVVGMHLDVYAALLARGGAGRRGRRGAREKTRRREGRRG